MKKINKDHLEKIQDQQKKLNEIIQQIGVLESQKHGLLHELAAVNKEVEDFKVELEGIKKCVHQKCPKDRDSDGKTVL